MIIWEKVGKRIRNIRGAKTQEEFGAELGVTKQYISSVETGRQKPSIELLYNISARYSVSVDYVLNGSVQQQANPQTRYPEASYSEQLTRLAQTLDTIWTQALEWDEETQIWLLVQLKRAIPEAIDENYQKDAMKVNSRK